MKKTVVKARRPSRSCPKREPAAAAPLDSRPALDPLAWAQYYLPHFFADPPCEFHVELLRDLAESDRRLIARVAPRGHAKSTCASLAFPLWCICERRRRNILIITQERSLAEQFLSDIRAELETNEAIRAAYGDLSAPPDARRTRPTWSRTLLITRTGIAVHAKGSGASLRGTRVGPQRPDLIICDDIEKDQLVRKAQQRRRLESWLRKVVLPALAPGGKVLVLGSILHFDSLLANLANPERFPRWDYRLYRAIEAEPHPCGQGYQRRALWPARWPLEKLEEERARVGTLAFEQEYIANPIDEEQPVFKPEWLHRYAESDLVHERLTTFICVDPATGKEHGDYFALWVGSVDAATRTIYTREISLARIAMPQQIERIVSACRQWRPLQVGIECIAYQTSLRDMVTLAFNQRGIHVPVVKVGTQQSQLAKTLRVRALTPAFENGRFRLPETLDPEVERQFLQYPVGDHDDAPDVCALAWEMVRELLQSGPVQGLARSRIGVGRGAGW